MLEAHAACLLALTRCTMMQEPELPMRPLQNHLPLDMHLTTHAGLWTPQYLLAAAGGVDAGTCYQARIEQLLQLQVTWYWGHHEIACEQVP